MTRPQFNEVADPAYEVCQYWAPTDTKTKDGDPVWKAFPRPEVIATFDSMAAMVRAGFGA